MESNPNPLLQQIAMMRQSLLDEEIVNGQFTEVANLKSDVVPDFAQDLINTYFQESDKILPIVDQEMAKTVIDYSIVAKCLHDLKGLCVSVGVNKMKIEVEETRECCRQWNIEGAKAGFGRVKREYDILKAKLNSYFQLVNQAKESGYNVDDPK